MKFVAFLIFAANVCLTQTCHAQSGNEQIARQLFGLTNRERVAAGERPLQWSDQLARAALAHSERMAERQDLSHQFPGEQDLGERLAGAKANFDACGENVAYASTGVELHEGWMHSPPHRKNLLSPQYDAIGIAVVRRGNLLYATQDFADLVADASPKEAEKVARDTIAQYGLREVSLVEPKDLKQAACSGQGPSLPARKGYRAIVHYSTSRPEELPDVLEQKLREKVYPYFSIAACVEPDSGHGFTSNRFVVVLMQ